MLIIILLLCIICCLYGIKCSKGRGNYWDNYLSLDNTLMLKGIFAIAVILHHLFQNILPRSRFCYYFEYVGPWCVMIFFFLSSYGIMYNYMHKRNYEKSFLKKRIKSILPLYVFAIFVYWISFEIMHHHYSLSQVLYSFIDGSPIVIHSWYIIVILFFYFYSYIQMKIFKKNYLLIFLSTLIICVVWIFVRPLLNYGWWWSVSVLSFPLGMLWAIYKTQIDKLIHKIYWPLLIFCLLSFIPSFIYTFNNYSFNYINFYWQSIIFPLTFILLTMKIKFSNKALKFLGSISLELYLFHGLFSNLLLLNTSLPEANHFMYCLLTMIFSIFIATTIHYLYKKILTANASFLKKRLPNLYN